MPAPACSRAVDPDDLGAPEGQRPLPVALRIDPSDQAREETAVERLEPGDQRGGGSLRRAADRRCGVQGGGDGQCIGRVRA